jgi:hypothetical protein
MKNNANLSLTFKHPVNIERLYRKPVLVDKMIMNIDQPDDFIAGLKGH